MYHWTKVWRCKIILAMQDAWIWTNVCQNRNVRSDIDASCRQSNHQKKKPERTPHFIDFIFTLYHGSFSVCSLVLICLLIELSYFSWYFIVFLSIMWCYIVSDKGEGWYLLKRFNPLHLFTTVLNQESDVQ